MRVILLFLSGLFRIACVAQAAKAGNLAYVKALLLQGQDPNLTDSTGQYTPLIAAAFLAHIEVLRAEYPCATRVARRNAV